MLALAIDVTPVQALASPGFAALFAPFALELLPLPIFRRLRQGNFKLRQGILLDLQGKDALHKQPISVHKLD